MRSAVPANASHPCGKTRPSSEIDSTLFQNIVRNHDAVDFGSAATKFFGKAEFFRLYKDRFGFGWIESAGGFYLFFQ